MQNVYLKLTWNEKDVIANSEYLFRISRFIRKNIGGGFLYCELLIVIRFNFKQFSVKIV